MNKSAVYMIAYTNGIYMIPIISKVYKNLGSAKNMLEKLKENYTEGELKILVADNWHDLEEQK